MRYDSVQEMFSHAAARFGRRIAIDRVGSRITYSELEAHSNNLANFLLDSGLHKGSMVGLLTDNPIEIITGILGALKAGAVFVPLDPSFPDRRLQAMTERAHPDWYVVGGKHLDKLSRLSAAANGWARVVCMDEQQIGAQPWGADFDGLEVMCGYRDYSQTTRPVVESDPEDACSIYFTSGSTGKPKAILGRLKGIDHFIRWEIETLGVGLGTRVSQLSSPSFDGFLKDAFVPLCAGGVVCAPESREIILDAGRLRDWLDIEQVEILHCIPSVFRSLINEGLESKYFKAMKYVVMAGEALLPTDVRRWMEVFGERIKLVNLYGPTETTILKLFHFVEPEDMLRPSIPIGKPIKGAAVMVINSGGQLCREGAVGEIHIRTPYCALGYYGEPELTGEAFIRNPFSDDSADIVYKTGDYGRLLENGSLEFLGRRDQQVKVRGVRVEIGEIENLLRGHQAVADVAVVDRDDADGNKFLVAYVICGGVTDSDNLRYYLSEFLPEAMLPSVFIKVEQLPRTLNGKIDRKALRSLELARPMAEVGKSLPRTPVEEIVSGIWCEVLKLPAVGRTDHFFNLGGHSLLITKVISRVMNTLNVELPVRSLFEAPTVAQLSQLIQEMVSEGGRSEQLAIEVAPRGGRLPLSFAQQRLWFIDQLDPGNAVYNMPGAVRLEGRLNLDVLERVINEIVRRHEVLRTRIEVEAGELIQAIDQCEWRKLEMEDLASLTVEQREEAISRIASEEAWTGFDLSRGPLLRVKVLKLAEDEHVLLYTMHHIVSDEWSMGVLIREVGALYQAYNKGEKSPLKELPIQYADFAVWQKARLKGEALEKEVEYWRRQLAGVEALKLPTDRPRPVAPSNRGAEQMFLLKAELAAALRDLSRQEGVTLFMTLLAAFQTLLYRYTVQEDIVVGTPIANRNRLELEGLIGFFVNSLALRTRLTPEISFRDLLHQVRETTLAAYSHDQMPFEKLVVELSPKRAVGENPLFQVWFFLDNSISNEEAVIPGIVLSPVKIDFSPAKLDLALIMTASSDNISGTFVYATDLFEVGTIVTLTERFQYLLQALVHNPDCKLLDIPLATLSRNGELTEAHKISLTHDMQATFSF